MIDTVSYVVTRRIRTSNSPSFRTYGVTFTANFLRNREWGEAARTPKMVALEISRRDLDDLSRDLSRSRRDLSALSRRFAFPPSLSPLARCRETCFEIRGGGLPCVVYTTGYVRYLVIFDLSTQKQVRAYDMPGTAVYCTYSHTYEYVRRAILVHTAAVHYSATAVRRTG